MNSDPHRKMQSEIRAVAIERTLDTARHRKKLLKACEELALTALNGEVNKCKRY